MAATPANGDSALADPAQHTLTTPQGSHGLQTTTANADAGNELTVTDFTNDEEDHSKPASTTIATQGNRTRVTDDTVEVVKKPKAAVANKKRKTAATPDHGTPQPADDDDEQKEEVFGDMDFRDIDTFSWKYPLAKTYTLSAKQSKALGCAVEIFNNDADFIFTSREKHEILRTLLKEQTASQRRNDLLSYSACRAFRKAFEAKPPTTTDFI
ncbi:hypothetical protein LZ31DRAFT_381381 [Colletotrichum somersetense]|nr:hypothetical protein LZ31DRAFT_381381 [Colletotrichum somersetense]